MSAWWWLSNARTNEHIRTSLRFLLVWLFFFTSSIWFCLRSLFNLVTGSLSNQILDGYSQKLCATVAPQHILQAGQLCTSKISWLSWCIHFSFSSPQSIFHIKDARTWGWRFYVECSLTSPCLMSCVGVVFIKVHVWWIAIVGEQSIVLSTTWMVWAFLWDHLGGQLSGCKPALLLKASFSDKSWLFGTMSLSYLEISLGLSSYILGSFHCTYHPSNTPHI